MSFKVKKSKIKDVDFAMLVAAHIAELELHDTHMGNVRAEEIYSQQGDLIFIKSDQSVNVAEAQRVKEFESHAFVPLEDKPVMFIPNEAKSIKNRLGFLYCEGIFKVDHPEHEPIKAMPAGLYEVRRCKSYENNPTGVWVLNID